MRAAALAGIGLFACAQSAFAQGCLPYEPATVSLSGRVRSVMAYGPPGFGEHPRTDAKEPYLDLVLDQPACVAPGPADDAVPGQVQDMQLLFLDGPADRSLVGKHVRIAGQLMGRSTGHHHTPVLVIVKMVQRQ